MNAELRIGLKGKAETIVTEKNTAKSLGSGLVDVFATPALIGLMEGAAVNALVLNPEDSSVGTALDIKHLAATPVGMRVWAEAELVEIDRRRLIFEVNAYDEVEKIGTGRHERFIIKKDQFLKKAELKAKNQE
ncbi:thioesterase family protein [Desulfitobacterium sp. Sab5]|uniref:thioesterase family protein n=1 Tax=Desulfitobacterium TaxID=36853 RepID=UPI003CF7BB11